MFSKSIKAFTLSTLIALSSFNGANLFANDKSQAEQKPFKIKIFPIKFDGLDNLLIASGSAIGIGFGKAFQALDDFARSLKIKGTRGCGARRFFFKNGLRGALTGFAASLTTCFFTTNIVKNQSRYKIHNICRDINRNETYRSKKS